MALNDTMYAYAVGRIRVLETRLLDRGRLERMVDAASAEDALKILSETGYAAAISEMEDVHDFEKILSAELSRTFDAVVHMSPKPELIQALLLRFDLHNLKVLFKAGYLGLETDLLVPPRNLDPAKLKLAIKESDFSDLPEKLQVACEVIAEDFVINHDPQIIDLVLDKVHYEQMLLLARKNRSSFLEGLYVHQVDLVNLNMLIRAKRMGLTRDVLKNILVGGGNIKEEVLLSLVDESYENISATFATSDYGELVADGVRNWSERGSAAQFEKLADNFITAYLKKNKWRAFGLEPLVGYLWGKEIEAKNIRLVMVGKINNLPAEAIRERLRDVYV